ncbi:MAG TPA: hypothetical protein EYG89_06120 [Bacteroidia bacterium]|nr:hypothetical protein [Bacteroidia bacterium]
MGMVAGKTAALGVEKYFSGKRKVIVGENELNLKNSKLDKGRYEFDFNEFLKLRTDSFEKLSSLEKKEF